MDDQDRKLAPGEGLKTLAWCCFVAAAFLAFGGLYAMYAASPLVGGDAYNLLIAATRGVGWIVAGCTAAALGVLLVVVAIFEQRTPKA